MNIKQVQYKKIEHMLHFLVSINPLTVIFLKLTIKLNTYTIDFFTKSAKNLNDFIHSQHEAHLFPP